MECAESRAHGGSAPSLWLVPFWGVIRLLPTAWLAAGRTLVSHCAHELRIPFEEGRLLASLVPGAQFVPLDRRNHLPRGDEPAWPGFLDAAYQVLGVGGER